MCSLSSPTFTSIFLCFYQTKRLKTCRKLFRSVFYKRDTHYINKKCKNIFLRLKLTIGAPFIFSILRCVKRKVNLQKLLSEKMSLVVNTLICLVS